MKKNVATVIKPALMLFFVSTFVLVLEDTSFLLSPYAFGGWLISLLSYQLISQILAYVTCLALVLMKNKGKEAVWGNYIVWTIILNIGRGAELLGM